MADDTHETTVPFNETRRKVKFQKQFFIIYLCIQALNISPSDKLGDVIQNAVNALNGLVKGDVNPEVNSPLSFPFA